MTGTVALRAAGRVTGKLRYGEMEIERGAKINGMLEEIAATADLAGDDAPAKAATPPASVARAKDRRARTGTSETTTA